MQDFPNNERAFWVPRWSGLMLTCYSQPHCYVDILNFLRACCLAVDRSDLNENIHHHHGLCGFGVVSSGLRNLLAFILSCSLHQNMCTCIYYVLYCLYCVFVLFRLCIFILICFVCTSLRTTATEWKLNCSK